MALHYWYQLEKTFLSNPPTTAQPVATHQNKPQKRNPANAKKGNNCIITIISY